MNPPYGPAPGAAGQGIALQRPRFLELLDQMRNEYDTLIDENRGFRGLREEYHRKVEETVAELSAMDQALAELDRKYQLMKEHYESEISRLKSGAAASATANIADAGPVVQSASAAGGATGLPDAPPNALTLPPPDGVVGTAQGAAANPASVTAGTVDANGGPDVAVSQPDGTTASTTAKRLPLPPASHGFGGPGVPTGPQGPAGPPAGAPLMGISSLPSATHTSNLSSVGGPRLMSNPDVNVPSLIKKDPTTTMPPSGPGPNQPNVGPSVIGGAPSVMNGTAQQAGEEQDYVAYQGRNANGSLVDMKVSLQNSFTHDSVVCCVRYSWNGDYLATGSNRSAHIFDVNTGQRVAVFSKDDGSEMDDAPGSDSYVRAVCFSPDGNWLITGAEDHVVKVWDVRNRTVKHKLVGHDTDIYSVDASANSSFIISGSGDKKAKLWSLETGALLSTLGGEFGPTDGITSVSVSPTSQHVAAGSLDKIVRVWDVESSRLVRKFEGHRDSVYSVAFSPDGRLLLSGSLDKTLKLWDLAASQASQQCRLTFTGHKDFVLSVAFSPDGRWLISGSKDRTVQFWDPRQPLMCLMLQGHKNSVISIAHSPTAMSLATGSGDCRARLWNVSQGQ